MKFKELASGDVFYEDGYPGIVYEYYVSKFDYDDTVHMIGSEVPLFASEFDQDKEVVVVHNTNGTSHE
jgi:hypothetical protein